MYCQNIWPKCWRSLFHSFLMSFAAHSDTTVITGGDFNLVFYQELHRHSMTGSHNNWHSTDILKQGFCPSRCTAISASYIQGIHLFLTSPSLIFLPDYFLLIKSTMITSQTQRSTLSYITWTLLVDLVWSLTAANSTLANLLANFSPLR